MKQSESVSICILLNENEFESKFCLENLVCNTDLNFELFLYLFKPNESVVKMLQSYSNSKNNFISLNVFNNNQSVTGVYNHFLNCTKNPYNVIIASDIIVNKHWLINLKHSYKNIIKSGCISLKSNSDKLILSSKLDAEDSLRTVYVSEENLFNDLVFFSSDKIKEIGYFNDKLKGVELAEWSFRFFANGYENYYLKYKNVIRLNCNDAFLKPKLSQEIKSNFVKILNNRLTVEKYN